MTTTLPIATHALSSPWQAGALALLWLGLAPALSACSAKSETHTPEDDAGRLSPTDADADAAVDGGHTGPVGNVIQGLKKRVMGAAVTATDALSMDVSGDGKTVLVGTQRERLLYSDDGGTTWFRVEGLGVMKHWVDVAISDDGQHLAALSDGLYLSADAGETWVVHEGGDDGYGILALSADGSTLVRGREAAEEIAVSKDFGATWVTHDLGSSPGYLKDLDVSADGQRIVASRLYGPFAVSHDGGKSWFESGLPDQQWVAAAASSDGMIVSAASAGDGENVDHTLVATSKDGGRTWTEHRLDNFYALTEIAASEDGQRILVCSTAEADDFRYSRDAGSSWEVFPKPDLPDDELLTENHVFLLQFALNESRIIALERNSESVYVTDDGGAHWKVTIQGKGDE